jgi:hypothetical protein
MRRALPLILALAAGCDPQPLDPQGEDLHDVFPFDEIRHWVYQTEDASVPYRLDADQQAESEVVGDSRVYTIAVTTDCFHPDDTCTELAQVDTWKMSSDTLQGVRVYAMGGETYDPPVLLADDHQIYQHATTSESGGVTFTSTYAARETCPAPKYWPDEANRPECIRVDLTDGGAGTAVAGSYWAVGNFGVVAYQHDVDGILWGLKDFDAEEF